MKKMALQWKKSEESPKFQGPKGARDHKLYSELFINFYLFGSY